MLGAVFSCSLQAEKPCKRLADLKSLEPSNILANQTGAVKQDLLAMRLRLSSHETMADRASQASDMQALPFSTVGKKKLLRKWRQERAKGQLKNGCPSFLPVLARQQWVQSVLQRPRQA